MSDTRLPEIFAAIIVGVTFLIFAIISIVIITTQDEPSTGSSCSTSSGCPGSQVCDSNTNTCKVNNGQACVSDNDCLTNSICLKSVCTAVTLAPIVPAVPVITTQSVITKPLPKPPILRPTFPKAPIHIDIPPLPPSVIYIPPQLTVSLPHTPMSLPSTPKDIPPSPIPSPVSIPSTPKDIPPSPIPSSRDLYPEIEDVIAYPMPPVVNIYSDTEDDGSYLMDYEHHVSINQKIDEIHANVIGSLDTITYGQETLTLVSHNTIKKSNGSTIVFPSVDMVRIEVCGSNIYCLTKEGNVERLYLGMGISEALDVFPIGVSHISATLDARNIWLQTQDGKGYLYDDSLSLVSQEEIDPNILRRYGYTSNSYTDTHRITCESKITTPNNIRTLYDSCSAILDHRDQVYSYPSVYRNMYRDMRLVSWKPYYVTSHKETTISIPNRYGESASQIHS